MAHPRPRVVRDPRSGRVRAFTSARAHRWQADLATVAAANFPMAIIDEPVLVAVLAVLPRPKRLLTKKNPDGLIWCDRRPDIDNIEKSCFDALRSFWRDDALIVFSPAMKAYAERAGRSRTVLRIRSILQSPEEVAREWGLV